MKKILNLITIVALMTLSHSTFARAPGGNGAASSRAASETHMSSQGADNGNGINSSHETGLDRAYERMNQEGLDNNKAQENEALQNQIDKALEKTKKQ
ncbi:MAG: hypothetical protein RLZZ564_710 [Pseudomonadota bacterium]|jgi:ABC-type microcin C transport system permease subunit YejB